jgi:hypothetical protein
VGQELEGQKPWLRLLGTSKKIKTCIIQLQAVSALLPLSLIRRLPLWERRDLREAAAHHFWGKPLEIDRATSFTL